jgi:hypothetical protein
MVYWPCYWVLKGKTHSLQQHRVIQQNVVYFIFTFFSWMYWLRLPSSKNVLPHAILFSTLLMKVIILTRFLCDLKYNFSLRLQWKETCYLLLEQLGKICPSDSLCWVFLFNFKFSEWNVSLVIGINHGLYSPLCRVDWRQQNFMVWFLLTDIPFLVW